MDNHLEYPEYFVDFGISQSDDLDEEVELTKVPSAEGYGPGTISELIEMMPNKGLLVGGSRAEHLFNNPFLIPSDWKGRTVLFLGTFYRQKKTLKRFFLGMEYNEDSKKWERVWIRSKETLFNDNYSVVIKRVAAVSEFVKIKIPLRVRTAEGIKQALWRRGFFDVYSSDCETIREHFVQPSLKSVVINLVSLAEMGLYFGVDSPEEVFARAKTIGLKLIPDSLRVSVALGLSAPHLGLTQVWLGANPIDSCCIEIGGYEKVFLRKFSCTWHGLSSTRVAFVVD